jgi:hypothetical protein
MEVANEVLNHEMLGDTVNGIRAQSHLPDDPFDSSGLGEDDDGPSTFTTDRNAPPPRAAPGFFHDRKEVPAETQWSGGNSVNTAHMRKLKVIQDEEKLRGVYEDDKSVGGSSNKKLFGSGGKHEKKHWVSPLNWRNTYRSFISISTSSNEQFKYLWLCDQAALPSGVHPEVRLTALTINIA